MFNRFASFVTTVVLTVPIFADTVVGVPTFVTDTSSTHLFQESINHQTGFSISQNDTRLKDLFNTTTGRSELCGPTTLANIMPYLKSWRSNPFPNLQLAQDPLQGDYSQVVRDFINRCHTDVNSGTLVVNMAACVQQFFIDSGYNHPQVTTIGSMGTGSNQRVATINDIRQFIKEDWALVVEMQWYIFNEQTNTWTYDNGGHYVAAVGYDYDPAWGDQIHLKVVNPEIDYRGRNSNVRWDSIDMLAYPIKPGETYPAYTRYILDGYNFSGITYRGFVRNIIAFIPEN